MNSKNLDDVAADITSKDKPLVQWETGLVKWFDSKRRFGFIYFDEPSGGVEDEAFFTWLVLQESRINETSMRPGTKVRFLWKPSRTVGDRPEVTRIALVHRRR
jgi:cold shock CspA family protein